MIGNVRLLGVDDSIGNLEDLVLDIVQGQFFVLAFRHLMVGVLLKLYLYVRTK